MNEDYGQELKTASETYCQQVVNSDPFPQSHKSYHLLLERAFMEGAHWYNSLLLKRREAELALLKSELQEVRINARS